MNIIKLVRNKTARFVHYRDGHFIYETEDGFQFPVPLDDIGTATRTTTPSCAASRPTAFAP